MKKNKLNIQKILVCDPLDPAGLTILAKQKNFKIVETPKATVSTLIKEIKDADAVIVRSGTTLTKEILMHAKQLKIIGRAGVGVDNVDVETASRMGIVVANTPAGNTISAAEHTMSLLLCMARNVAPAHQSMAMGAWDRKKFTGIEVFGKTLGLIGLGRIGAEVARRAQSFGITVLAYDPFLLAEKAREVGVLQVELNQIFKQSDFISMHVPLTSQTRNLINAAAIEKMKKGVRIVNCARGGLIDEAAALGGLNSGKIAGIALDVYEIEPPKPSKFLSHPQVLKTPHLGASTEEAQIKVSVDIAHTVTDMLTGKGIRNSVNVSFVEPELLQQMEPYCQLASKLGELQGLFANEGILNIDLSLSGKVKEFPRGPLVASLLMGILKPILGDDINLINAPFIAKERGMKVAVTEYLDPSDFSSLIQVKLKTKKAKHLIAGTVYGNNNQRIVMVDGMRMEIAAKGDVLMIQNKDVPGMVGHIGSILGKSKLNIADMSVGRDKKLKRAQIFINVDAEVSNKVLGNLCRHKDILAAHYIRF